MRKFFKMVFLFLITMPVLTGCPPPPPTPEYSLNLRISPEEANDFVSVAPDQKKFEEGESVTLRASSGGDWQFKDWSGDINTSENPHTITMNQSYTITANFTTEPVPTFSAEIPITDGVHSQTVTLVSEDDGTAQNGLDSNDREGPPIAPPGAFFTGFVVDGMNLYKDVRQASSNIVWELRLNRASGETITLEDWSISETDIGGSLMLVDDPNDPTPNIELDLQTASSFSVSDPSIQRLYVVYEQDVSSKVITDMPTMGKELEIQEKADPSMDRLKEGVRNTNEPNQFQQKNQ